jgi:biotin transport system substrate-specific component
MASMEEFTARSESWSKAEGGAFKLVGAAVFAFLTFLGAEVRIPLPFTPIPMTLQTFVVPLAGGFLGAVWGTASMILYLALGLFGLRVFAAAPAGIGFFSAPSAGYLLGYVFAAAIVGAAPKNRRLLLLGSIILAHMVIFLCGILGLMWNARMGIAEAFAKGMAPFLIGDAIKIAASFLVLISFSMFRKQ